MCPLPIAEADTLVSGWLEREGFDIRKVALKMGQMQLSAVRNGETLQIRLTPDSPLATQVALEGVNGKEGDSEKAGQLWKHIEDYIRIASTADNSFGYSVPSVIVSKTRAVVCVKAVSGEKEIQFSGFIVDRDGLVICTAHDLKNIRSMSVMLHDGRRLKARMVKTDRHRDLILLHVSMKSENVISLNEGRELVDMGERLYAIGCPDDLRGTVLSGVVNGPLRKVADMPLWQVNMEILPGSSGSPVFDTEGRLVGVVKGRLRGASSVGFLIPMKTLIAFVKER